MSPILVRPVREQLEHDRVIRALQAKLKRKFDVAVNAGNEATVPLRVGRIVVYPDLLLTSPRKKGALAGVVEVETAESINHLEAMAQRAGVRSVAVSFGVHGSERLNPYDPLAIIDELPQLLELAAFAR